MNPRNRRRSVAQICNLLYRRIVFGQPPRSPSAHRLALCASGLKIRATADYKSALRWQCHQAALVVLALGLALSASPGRAQPVVGGKGSSSPSIMSRPMIAR